MPAPTAAPTPAPLPTAAPLDYSCQLVDPGYGPAGTDAIGVEVMVEGLEVPWGLAFLPDGNWLVTERDGRVRRVTPQRELVEEPVLVAPSVPSGEGGLLGIAVHPEFEENRWFYLFYTGDEGGTLNNRVVRYTLSADMESATFDRIILEGLPANTYHDGGRIRFGPDGKLYATMGDAGLLGEAADPESRAAKVFRLEPDGRIPADNPIADNPAYLFGVRNSQGIDWRDDGRMVLVDHGPSFEFGLRGFDELNIADAGTDLGWPEIVGCEQEGILRAPTMSWRQANPPGGLAVYRGDELPQWRGDLIIGVLGFGDDIGHLQRVRLDDKGNVTLSEVYLQGEYGRLRDVIMGPDGGLYVTTSNCGGRSSCPEYKDRILRIGAPRD